MYLLIVIICVCVELKGVFGFFVLYSIAFIICLLYLGIKNIYAYFS